MIRRKICTLGGVVLALAASGVQAYQPSPSLIQWCNRVAVLNHAAAQMRDQGVDEAQAIVSIDELVKNQDDKDSLKVGILVAYEKQSNIPAEEVKTRAYQNCLATNHDEDMKSQSAIAEASTKGQNTIVGTWNCQSVIKKIPYIETFKADGSFFLDGGQSKSWGTYQMSDGNLTENVTAYQSGGQIKKISNTQHTKIVFNSDGSYKFNDVFDAEYRCDRG